jgi:hypothetical protein
MTGSPSLQRWQRDDWVIPCTVEDSSGTPIDLTGFVVGAELFLAGYSVFSPLSLANGGIVRVSDAAGQFTVVVPRALTAAAPGDADLAGVRDRTRVRIFWIDTYGRRQTLGTVPFEVFDGSENLPIDEVPAVTIAVQSSAFRIVVASAQGAPGPSSIAAAQITDGSDLGRQVLKAPDAASARLLLGVPSIGRQVVQDADYLAKKTDTFVAYVSLTAPRTVTLPFAEEFPPGQPLWIADESGACSDGMRIVIAASGHDMIAGQASQFMANPYAKIALHSNGTDLWTL